MFSCLPRLNGGVVDSGCTRIEIMRFTRFLFCMSQVDDTTGTSRMRYMGYGPLISEIMFSNEKRWDKVASCIEGILRLKERQHKSKIGHASSSTDE